MSENPCKVLFELWKCTIVCLICLSFVHFLEEATSIMLIYWFVSEKKKNNKLTESQIKILRNYYCWQFDARKAWETFTIHRANLVTKCNIQYIEHCVNMWGQLLKINKKKCLSNGSKKHLLYDDIHKNCYKSLKMDKKT